jgi:Tat protein translocase TatB subunit
MFGLGPGEMLVILVVGLIVLGPKRLPDAGRALGRAMVEFRRASADLRTAVTEPLSEPQPTALRGAPARTAATSAEAQAKPVVDVAPVARSS